MTSYTFVHYQVIAIKDMIRPPNPRDFKDVYVVYELMPTDLHEVIRSNQPMDERHFRVSGCNGTSGNACALTMHQGFHLPVQSCKGQFLLAFFSFSCNSVSVHPTSYTVLHCNYICVACSSHVASTYRIFSGLVTTPPHYSSSCTSFCGH